MSYKFDVKEEKKKSNKNGKKSIKKIFLFCVVFGSHK